MAEDYLEDLDTIDVVAIESTDVTVVEEEESQEVQVWTPGKAPISFLRCASCYLKKTCPYCDVSSEKCALKELEQIDTTTGPGIIGLVQEVIRLQAERVLRFAKIEEAEGGYPDPNLTNEFAMLLQLIEKFKKILSDDDMILIKAKGKNATGVLAQIFGDLKED